MAGTIIPFPTTSAPGRKPGEGSGCLYNCFAHKNVDELEILRVPGTRVVFAQPQNASPDDPVTPRGMMGSDTQLFSAWLDRLTITTPGGVITDRSLPGSLPVTMARNLRQPIPDKVIVTENGAFIIDDTGVHDYPSPYVGFPNSGSYFSGYFMFTYGDGSIRASELQQTDMMELSVARAEQNPDGLYRGISSGSTWFAMGPRTVEAWQDQATSPFPLQRTSTLPVGLMGPWAVAGGGEEWDRDMLFVASDYTVRQLVGLNPKIVSTKDVAADIYDQRSKPSQLMARVHVSGDNAFWCLTCPSWTWEYNLTTQSWHKRRSYFQGAQQSRWRASWSVNCFNKWLCQDRFVQQIIEITTDVFDECGERLIARCESGPLKEFPLNIRVPAAHFDFTVGQGRLTGVPPFEVDPCVMISWSHDGAATWANPLRRSLGQQGRFGQRVSVNNMGRSTHHGVRFAWEIVDPVHFRFRGGVVEGMRQGRPSPASGLAYVE